MLKIRLGSLKEQSLLGASPRPITNTPDYIQLIFISWACYKEAQEQEEKPVDMLKYTGQQLAGALNLPVQESQNICGAGVITVCGALRFLFHLAFYDCL